MRSKSRSTSNEARITKKRTKYNPYNKYNKLGAKSSQFSNTRLSYKDDDHKLGLSNVEESYSYKPTEFSKKDKALKDSARNASDAQANMRKGRLNIEKDQQTPTNAPKVQQIRDSIQRYKSYFKNRSAFSPHSIQTQADHHNQASSLRTNQNHLTNKHQYKKSPSP